MLVATAPSPMNTRLNPAMNISELNITRRSRGASASCNVSIPVPEISETYPGTSGKTHGDRKERIPATNAAKGKGKLCILIYGNNTGFSDVTRLSILEMLNIEDVPV